MKCCLIVLFCWLAVATSAQSTLHVTDAEGAPLVGATVLRQPTTLVGVTDEAGDLVLPEFMRTDTFQINYLGFLPALLAGTQVQEERTVLQLTEQYGGLLLDAATVVGRRDELAATLPYQIQTVDAEAIARVQSLTTADALGALSGVYVQKSQLGAGSPVLRGFEANT